MNEQPQIRTEWQGSQKFLHWLMAVLILAQIGLGILLANWEPEPPMSYILVQSHKTVGFTLLVLVLVRLFFRFRYGGLPFPAGMPLWEQWLSNGVHFLLYAIMVVQPVTGWLMGSAAGYPTRPFGLFALPDLVEKNRELALRLGSIHGMLALALIVLLVLHVAGAFKHHFIDRDDILRRMLPGRKARATGQYASSPDKE